MNFDKMYFSPVSGAQCYELNGLLHRLDGPAWISHYRQIWFFHGLKHREDGPAVQIFSKYEDREEFWFYGEQVSSLDELQKIVKLKAFM